MLLSAFSSRIGLIASYPGEQYHALASSIVGNSTTEGRAGIKKRPSNLVDQSR
jgi:hypothetical protein